jgi:4-hydroxy-2-oxoheptanedioate aldolase
MTRYPGYFRNTGELQCFAMIETVQALDNLSEIAAVPGLTGLYVGPADLSLTMGLRPRPDQDDERFQQALHDVVSACKANGIIPGVHASAELAEARRAAGFTMITVSFDHAPVMAALAADLQQARGETD